MRLNKGNGVVGRSVTCVVRLDQVDLAEDGIGESARRVEVLSNVVDEISGSVTL